MPALERGVWEDASESHPGKCRQRNEDAVLARRDLRLWAVADGMGGHAAGDVASDAVCSALGRLSLRGDLADRVDRVEDTLHEVNDDLRQRVCEQSGGRAMGSTVVAMLADASVGVALWAGDSRLYRLRAGMLELITRDHNPVFDLLDSGTVTESEVLAADTHVITRAVGGFTELFLDVVVFDIQPADTFLLCSDGLYRELRVDELIRELSRGDVFSAARGLLSKGLATAARDNLSFVVVRPARQT